MTTELFSGRAEALKDRVIQIKTAGATNISVVPTSQNCIYLIIYS